MSGIENRIPNIQEDWDAWYHDYKHSSATAIINEVNQTVIVRIELRGKHILKGSSSDPAYIPSCRQGIELIIPLKDFLFFPECGQLLRKSITLKN